MNANLFSRRRAELIGGGVLLLTVLGLAALFIDHHLDRSYIIYRYALNFRRGLGLVYHPDQLPVLSGAVAPLYAFILGLAAFFTPDLPFLSNALGAASIALGGLALYGLAQPAGKTPALVAAGFYVMFPLLWITLGLETSTWMALCLGAVWLHQARRGIGASMLLALATLMRPEAAVLAVVLAADALAGGRSFRFWPICLYAVSIMSGGLWVLATYQADGLLPGWSSTPNMPDAIGANLLAGLPAFGQAFLTPFWSAPALIGAWGAFRLKGQRWAVLLVGWALLHLLALAVVQAEVYIWTFAPLVAALAALVSMGVLGIIERVRQWSYSWAAAGAAMVVCILPLLLADLALASVLPDPSLAWLKLAPAPVDDRYAQAGVWLRSHAALDARVGAARIGVLGYFSQRALTDYHGSLQPNVAGALARGDSQWWLASAEPEYIVLTSRELTSLGGYDLTQDAWFISNYVEASRFTGPAGGADPLLILRRTSPPPAMSKIVIGYVSYPDGLTVNGISADFPLFPMEGGRVGLVQLEWLVDETIAAPQVVTIQIQGRGGGAVAGLSSRTIDFSAWPHRRLITSYHPIHIAAGLPSGVYDIQVGIGPDAFTQTWRMVGQAKVPFYATDMLGGISGARTEFGDVALLGYRLARTEQGLEVLLLWEAVHSPQADYQVFVQIRDLGGAIIARDVFQPHGGSYPTSIWSAGEQVPDAYLLDISGIPAGTYQVYVGLLNSDDTRILTLDGRDAMFVGQIDVTP